MIDKNRPRRRAHNPHQAGAGGQIFVHFGLYVVKAIRGRYDFDGEIWREGPVGFGYTRGGHMVLGDESRIRGSNGVRGAAQNEASLGATDNAEAMSLDIFIKQA